MRSSSGPDLLISFMLWGKDSFGRRLVPVSALSSQPKQRQLVLAGGWLPGRNPASTTHFRPCRYDALHGDDLPVGLAGWLVFTPGYTGTFTDYTYLFEGLASRGQVVGSIDHTYEAPELNFPMVTLQKSVVGSHLSGRWQLDDQVYRHDDAPERH